MQPATLQNNEECPQPHDNMSGWQELHSASLFLIKADHCSLEALCEAGLSSLFATQAS